MKKLLRQTNILMKKEKELHMLEDNILKTLLKFYDGNKDDVTISVCYDGVILMDKFSSNGISVNSIIKKIEQDGKFDMDFILSGAF